MLVKSIILVPGVEKSSSFQNCGTGFSDPLLHCIVMTLASRAITDDIAAFANYQPSSCFKYIPHACLPRHLLCIQRKSFELDPLYYIIHFTRFTTWNSSSVGSAKLNCISLNGLGSSLASTLPEIDIFLSIYVSVLV